MSQIRKLFRASSTAMQDRFGAPRAASYPLPFPIAEIVLDEEELALVESAVLGAARRDLAQLEPALTVSENGPWIWSLAENAQKKIASLPAEATTQAASYLLDVEESDLSGQAKSRGAIRDERIAFWEQMIADLRSFCIEAMQHGERVFLYHAL